MIASFPTLPAAQATGDRLAARGFDTLLLDIARGGSAAGGAEPPFGVRSFTLDPEAMRLTARASVSRPSLEVEAPAPRDAAVRGSRQVHFPGVGFVKCPIYDREDILEGDPTAGPAVIEQMDTTTIVFPGQKFESDRAGNLIIQSA